MRATLGVTDNAWAAYLREHRDVYEANFWVPSGGSFRSLKPGEPFLFKTKAPDRKLVGGGFFVHFWELRISEAWAAFGEGNGVASERELHDRIQVYRERTKRPFQPDPTIGCIILRNLFFAPPGQEFPQPQDWGRSIMTWKNYDLDSPEGEYVAHVFRSLQSEARIDRVWDVDLEAVDLESDHPRYGAPVLTRNRLGQGSFRVAVAEAYQRRCAVTGSRIVPALQAAHIKPYADGGRHVVRNGLLLRSDVHSLFDKGYVGVDGAYRLRVSPRLRSDFGNGAEFYRSEARGVVINLPETRHEQPDPDVLDWHMRHVFLSA